MAFFASEPLNKIISGFKNIRLPGVRASKAIGIDIGTSTIKVVELAKKKNKIYLVKYGSLALGPYAKKNIGEPTNLSNPKIVEALVTLFDELFPKVKRSDMGGLFSIPLKSSLLTVIEIPKLEESKLDNVVKLEARKYIPFPHNEVTINWIVIPDNESFVINKDRDKNKKDNGNEENAETTQTGKLHVMVVAIHNNTLESYQELSSLVGLKKSSFEVEVFSIIRSIIDDDKSLYAILDIGSDSTKIAVVERGRVISSHTVNVGSQSVTDTIARDMGIDTQKAEELKRHYRTESGETIEAIKKIFIPTLESMFSEVGDALNEFEKQADKKIEKIYLAGGGSMLDGITTVAKNILKKETILGEPFKKVEPPAEILRPILKNESPEFAVASGLALRAVDEL
jgi:type IV pilus assembly protein PilM